MRTRLVSVLLGIGLAAVVVPAGIFALGGSTLDACVAARTSMIQDGATGADRMSAFCEDLAAARLQVLLWTAGGAVILAGAFVALILGKKEGPGAASS